MKKALSFLLAVTMLLSLVACAQKPTTEALSIPEASPSSAPKTVTDSSGNVFDLPMELNKIIVLNSSVYEMIYCLGKDDIVIGVGDSTNYPAKPAAAKAKYGDWKEPNVELILEADPDAVIGYASWLESGIAKQLTDAGIPVIMLDFYVPTEIAHEVEVLGQLLGVEDRAAEFVDDLEKVQNLVKERTADVEPLPVFYEGYTEYKSVGAGSGGTQLMELANVKSLTAEETVAYPEISDEWLIEANPAMIIKLVSSTKGILGEDIADDTAVKDLYASICSRPGWASVDAVANGKILILSSRIGTTPLGMAMAPLYIAKMAYPDKFKDVNPDANLNELLVKYWGTEMTGLWSYKK